MPVEYNDPVIYWRKKVRGRNQRGVVPIWRSKDGVRVQYARQMSMLDWKGN